MEMDPLPVEVPSAAISTPRPKVLFLWDDAPLPDLSSATVGDEFEVVTVHTPERALAALAADPFCAIFLRLTSDICGGGNEFIRELDHLHNGVPVMIVTSAVSRQQVGEIMLLADVPHSPWPPCVVAAIPLPINHQTILAALSAAVDRSPPQSSGETALAT